MDRTITNDNNEHQLQRKERRCDERELAPNEQEGAVEVWEDGAAQMQCNNTANKEARVKKSS